MKVWSTHHHAWNTTQLVLYHDAETQCETTNLFDARDPVRKSITMEYCHTNTCTT